MTIERFCVFLLVILVGTLIKEHYNSSGRAMLHKKIDKVKEDYIHRNTCHRSMDSLKETMQLNREHIDQRLDDLKDVIIKNGHK